MGLPSDQRPVDGVVSPREGTLRAVAAGIYVAALSAAALFLLVTLDHRLWLDDLYTIALVRAPTLGHLLAGVALGIDGNPPLYMTLAWLVARLPFGTVETKLLSVNIALGAALLVVLFRIARRFVCFESALAAIALMLFANPVLIEAVLHLRTYPLFILCTAASALFQLRLLRAWSRADAIGLAACCCALAMSHTFGIVYACAIVGSAALTVAWHRGVRASLAGLAPIVPALLVFAAWTPWLLEQATVAQPYGWILPPTGFDLALTVALGRKAGVIGALMTTGIVLLNALRARTADARGPIRTDADPELQGVLVALSVFIGLAVAVWVFSKLSFPIFVARYFAPNLLVYFAVATAFAGSLFGLLTRKLRWLACGAALGLGSFAVASATPQEGAIPCFDAASRTFVDQLPGMIDPKLPVVTVSPHAWFPRVYYAPSPATYVFPLDWDVVLKFPYRERNNAVDFNIMKRFQAWAGVPNIITTDALIGRYREFYVVNESARAWLDNLKQSRTIDETVLATSETCSLIRVRVPAP